MYKGCIHHTTPTKTTFASDDIRQEEPPPLRCHTNSRVQTKRGQTPNQIIPPQEQQNPPNPGTSPAWSRNINGRKPKNPVSPSNTPKPSYRSSTGSKLSSEIAAKREASFLPGGWPGGRDASGAKRPEESLPFLRRGWGLFRLRSALLGSPRLPASAPPFSSVCRAVLCARVLCGEGGSRSGCVSKLCPFALASPRTRRRLAGDLRSAQLSLSPARDWR